MKGNVVACRVKDVLDFWCRGVGRRVNENYAWGSGVRWCFGEGKNFICDGKCFEFHLLSSAIPSQLRQLFCSLVCLPRAIVYDCLNSV